MVGPTIFLLLVVLDLCVVAGWAASSRDTQNRRRPMAVEVTRARRRLRDSNVAASART